MTKIAYLPIDYWPEGSKEEILEAVKTHPKRKEFTIPGFVEAFNNNEIDQDAYCAFIDNIIDIEEMFRLERLQKINYMIRHFQHKKEGLEESLTGIGATSFPNIKRKVEHDIEIADMAIKRLRIFYRKELNK